MWTGTDFRGLANGELLNEYQHSLGISEVHNRNGIQEVARSIRVSSTSKTKHFARFG